jgi:hypothetical protein
MTLLQLINQRREIAKTFTKDFHDEVKKCIDDYKAKDDREKTGVTDRHLQKKRYSFTIPYIFSTHESLMASFFESLPEIIITGRSKNTQVEAILKAMYSYFQDKLDLDEVLNTSAWWFFLVGFLRSTVGYKVVEGDPIPQLDSVGQPMIDEMTGEMVTIPSYTYHDPIVDVDDVLKITFSPDSEFSISGDKIPYSFVMKLMDPDEVLNVFDEVVEPNAEVELEDGKKNDKEDLKRCEMYFYTGQLPSTVEDFQEYFPEIEWKYGKEYYIVCTAKKIIHAEEKRSSSKYARYFNVPREFFGYGIGKTLRDIQKEISLRKGQKIRYADLHSFPWLAVDGQTKVDQNSLMDITKRKPLIYSEKKPEYIVPPPMNDALTKIDEEDRSDAQFISGMLDLSKGAQQTTTVKTATGQQLFAQSQDKRLQKARKVIAKYYRELVIEIFKQAIENWEDEKKISYYNDEEQVDMVIKKEDLQEIDLDTDIDFNLDSASVNQDIISQRWISLLEQAKSIPEVADLPAVWKKTIREAFKVPNPENYTNQQQPPSPETMTGEIEASVEEQEPPVEPAIEQPIGQQLAPDPGLGGTYV